MYRLDLARIEGLGVSFMCSNLVEVRKAALDVLFTVRELHGRLLTAGARSNPVTPAAPSSSPTPGTHTRTLARGPTLLLLPVNVHCMDLGYGMQA